jgi:XRE family transcriptional regulator, aerobic/anaerobic benzoate catabolism transcriptional regulator
MGPANHRSLLLQPPSLREPQPPLPDGRYLASIGLRVREARLRRGLTRKGLARASGVSERYLAQLEAGEGNASVLLLRQIARAVALPVESLLTDAPEASPHLLDATETLRRLNPRDLERANALLLREFSGVASENHGTRLALIGLRGAGKSTLGAQLAERLGVPFIELDRRIEAQTGMKLGEIFDLYGQSGYRRFERECLQDVLRSTPRFVLATGGGIVSDTVAFDLLLAECRTIWLRATPEDHMKRVMAQGDMRPMANHREAMADLRNILAGREPLYRKAHATLDTSARSPQESLRRLLQLAHAVSDGNGKRIKANRGKRS